MIRIKLAGIFVNNQSAALAFYTQKLGFAKKTDLDMGQFRWLTITTADDVNGIELLLEPNNNPAAAAFQQSMHEQGIPATAFMVDDINDEYNRLQQLGVQFKAAPQKAGKVTIAMLNDTCGNWIQLYQLE